MFHHINSVDILADIKTILGEMLGKQIGSHYNKNIN
jgi:hypothetical protein